MDDLTKLFQDAVADVEPADRLAEIRSATATKPRRLGWYAAGGTALAVAAAVTTIAFVTSPDTPRATDDPDPLGTPTSAIDTPTPGLRPTPVYYVGDTPQGPRLFREFQLRGGGSSPVAAQAMTSPPDDPDYRTLWPAGSIASVGIDNGHFTVTLTDASLHDRPAGMTPEEAELAIQQLVYTIQAADSMRLPVQLRLGSNPIDTVFGVPTSEPITNEPELDVLSLVVINDPVEGLQVDDSFIAHGAAISFEGNVPWELRDPDGTVVRSGQAAAGMDDHLIDWDTQPIDVSDLEPGRYTFVATTDDGAFTDTRTVVVL